MLRVQILHLLVTFFISLYLLRPLVPSLVTLKGVVFFPLIALFTLVLAFFTQGAQTQFIPLFFISIILVFHSIPSFLRQIRKLKTDYLRPRKIILAIISLALFLSLSGVLFFYGPREEPEIAVFSHAPLSFDLPLKDLDKPLSLRIFPPSRLVLGREDILVLLFPPAVEAHRSTERLARELAFLGYWTASFSSPSYDFPAIMGDNSIRWPELKNSLRYTLASLVPPQSDYALSLRKDFLSQRRDSAESFYNWLIWARSTAWTLSAAWKASSAWSPLPDSAPAELADFYPERLALIGFGEGAEAALHLADRYSRAWQEGEEAIPLPVVALCLIEPLFAPSEEQYFLFPPELSKFQRILYFLQRGLGFRQNAAPEPAYMAEGKHDPETAILLLTGEAALRDGLKESRYAPVHSIFKTLKTPVLLSVFNGFGPSDFSSFPYLNPLSSLASDWNARPAERLKGKDFTEKRNKDGSITLKSASLISAFLDKSLYGHPFDFKESPDIRLIFNEYWSSPFLPAIISDNEN